MRKLEYILTRQDGPLSVRRVMKERLHLSAKEISHAKHFTDGMRAVLKLNLGGEDRRRLHKEIFTNACREEGRADKIRFNAQDLPSETEVQVRVNEILYPGETLTVTLHEMEDDRGRIIPVPGSIDILYEDEDLILLNKPAGIVSHPSPGHTDDSLSNHLAWYFENANEPHRIRIIGRLDKEASGVLLFAKTRMAAAALKQEGAYDKEYLAVCEAFFSREEESGTIRFPIRKRPEVILKREISEDGEPAITHYRVLEQGHNRALVRLKLETGRTHQIRVHMAAIGHPLVGDRIYHPDGKAQCARAMLHAEKMHIKHPLSGKELIFTAPIPKDMQALIKDMLNSQKQ